MKSLQITAACVHHVPGRLRMRIEEMRHNRAAAARLAQFVETAPGVTSVRANPLTGSLVIHYDCAQTRQSSLLSLLNGGTPGAAPRRREKPAEPASAALAAKIGPPAQHARLAGWLLGKTVEFAIEKSLVLAIGALL